jgi:hypothetical protein
MASADGAGSTSVGPIAMPREGAAPPGAALDLQRTHERATRDPKSAKVVQMNRTEDRNAEARRAAQAQWDKLKKREAEVVKDKERARRADVEKTARLRELRLAADAAKPQKAAPVAKAARAAKR